MMRCVFGAVPKKRGPDPAQVITPLFLENGICGRAARKHARDLRECDWIYGERERSKLEQSGILGLRKTPVGLHGMERATVGVRTALSQLLQRSRPSVADSGLPGHEPDIVRT